LVNKFPGDRWQKMATLRALYGYMWAHPGKKLIFMGDEFAQNDEWSESRSLDWHLTQYDEHAQIQKTVRTLNEKYRKNASLWDLDDSPTGFQWLVGDDADGNTLAFLRKSRSGEEIIAITNFSPVPHHHYRIPNPAMKDSTNCWREIFNSDAMEFGGTGMGNQDPVTAIEGGEFLEIVLPPLATIWLARA
jgi:1,4-alpha-glucan branching enzyme